MSTKKASSPKKCQNKACTCGDNCACGETCKCGEQAHDKGCPLSKGTKGKCTCPKKETKEKGGCGNPDCTCKDACECGADCKCGKSSLWNVHVKKDKFPWINSRFHNIFLSLKPGNTIISTKNPIHLLFHAKIAQVQSRQQSFPLRKLTVVPKACLASKTSSPVRVRCILRTSNINLIFPTMLLLRSDCISFCTIAYDLAAWLLSWGVCNVYPSQLLLLNWFQLQEMSTLPQWQRSKQRPKLATKWPQN